MLFLVRRSESKKGRCSECQKVRVIYRTFPDRTWGPREFCKDCWEKLHKQPDIRHRHRLANINDACTCEHDAFLHHVMMRAVTF